jgi:ATP-dependent Lhr-like helicase
MLSPRAQKVLDSLRLHGASFFSDLRHDSGLLAVELEQALGELVAQSHVNCDSFAGLRTLVISTQRRARLRRHYGRHDAGIDQAGRWSLLRRARPSTQQQGDGANSLAAAHVEHIARGLLRRYGVVFRKLLEREEGLPPWRELHYVYRRLEARGEISGGRFVSGFSGEQFALSEAAMALRGMPAALVTERVFVAAVDPLNLVGVLVPGEKVPRQIGNAVLFEAGAAVATQIGSEVRYCKQLSPEAEWDVRNVLIRRTRPFAYQAVQQKLQ